MTTFSLPIDDLEWTKHWLGRLRCDQLLVAVASEPADSPKICLRAIESKSNASTTAIEPSVDVEPFQEAAGQVVATLDALWDLVSPADENALVADLRLASFAEHLSSIILSALYPVDTSHAT